MQIELILVCFSETILLTSSENRSLFHSCRDLIVLTRLDLMYL